MLTIAIPVPVGRQLWHGGINYFRNLLKASNAYAGDRYRLVLLSDQPKHFADAEGPNVSVTECKALDHRSSAAAFASKAFEALSGYNPMLLRAASSAGADLISHGQIGARSGIPTLPWMPDFQHCALPKLFSEKELASRDKFIDKCIGFGQLLVSSKAAESDFRLYYPQAAPVQVHVLRFPALAQPSSTEIPGRSQLCREYSLPERFVFLPNQFWEHKNHAIVVEALAQVSEDITVVCTGSPADHRNSHHYANLVERINQLGLQQKMRMLGVVPYPVVLGLMRHALAVLNPSLFEGWSTTVEEAKALNKPLILSSIAVHVEQVGDQAAFFDPKDAAGLARHLTAAFAGDGQAGQTILERMPISAEQKQRDFVDHYYQIARQSAGHRVRPV